MLLIVLDNVRADDLSLYGYDRETTPNLERLAREGVRFTEARSTAPWTLPSHASMFTGRWPHELSVGPDRRSTRPSRPWPSSWPAGVRHRRVRRQHLLLQRLLRPRPRLRPLRGLLREPGVSLFEVVRSSAWGRRVVEALGYPIRVADGGTSVRKTAAMINRDVLGWLDGRPATGRSSSS